MNNYLLTLLLLCIFSFANAQKSLELIRSTEPIKIDGIFDEPIWDKAPIADDFKQYRPSPGPTQHKTQVKLVYDDEAIYIAAYMADVSRDSIMTQLTERDDIGNTDFFGFYIDTYQNGNEATEFIIAATGVQFDAKLDPNNEDQNWDAVWFSEVRLTDEGWYAEIMIPYSAIRFPKKDVQSWNVNFFRRRSVAGTQDGWVFVDFERDNPFLTQVGVITGMKNIKPPLRLSISPYASTYVQNSYDKNRTPSSSTGYSYNGGLDVKYGINDAFTLDMTLIPDFGQVQSDDQVLNLSPFEVRFDEQRQFFTEGTELFNKADLFYSRRVGGSPIGIYNVYNELGESEEITSNPQAPQLYNATKISGRNSKGIGAGIFNAVSAETNATITNKETGTERQFQTAPLTNYSVIVVDKNLKNNSSASITNTNVWRNGDSFHSANVSAATFNLKNKGQKWGVSGDVKISQILNPLEENVNGHSYSLGLSRLSGKIQYGIQYEELSNTYNPNDLGFLRSNNSKETSVWAQYNDVDGFGPFVQFQTWFNGFYERLYKPKEYVGLGFNGGFFAQGKNQWYYNLWSNAQPERNNYFEARVDGRNYKRPSFANTGIFIGTDNRKPWRIELLVWGAKYDQEGRTSTQFQLGPRYRFSDKFNMGFSTSIEQNRNDEGFVAIDYKDDIIFGRRDVRTISNRITSTYTFNQKMNLEFRLRHYWSKVNYKSFHTLMQDGYLSDTDYSAFNDNSFNTFNIDMVYRWRFAPGSDIFVVWKNNIFGADSDQDLNYRDLSYRDGLGQLNDLLQNNSFSLRVVYYLDYAQLNRVF